ncbi:type III PLP-dependent enzyme [Kitasatospora phosalacinea]|uniref:type III PLP-dependent enzyme n=1 Tax=Kitasatospora phosalacinea TaxID=2065 RepID=UPI0035E1A429
MAEPDLSRMPTPCYVYDLAEVRRNHTRLRAALPAPSHLFYSLKANPHPDLLTALRRCGTRPEVCSSGELSAALDAGWGPDQVLYTGPAKRDADIREALARGVRFFSVDSPHGIDQLDGIALDAGARVRCLLRVNDDHPVPGQGLAMTGVPSQFGADTSWILSEPARFASRPHAEVIGLHLYMGSNIDQVPSLAGQFERSLRTAARVAAALSEYGVRLRFLDLGGGFGAPFAQPGQALDLSSLALPVSGLLDEHAPGWREHLPEIAFESGRYLVGTAGTLVTSVLEVKRSHDRDVVVLESGINHLGGMSGLRRLPPLNPVLTTRDETTGTTGVPTLVAGPLCTPLDTWARSAALPPLKPGDRLEVPNVGAYGLAASLVAFLGHPLPTEMVIDSDDPERRPTTSRIELVRTAATSR